MTFTPLPAHPLANLFPMFDQPDLERLADDICTFGQREPIIVLDGQVLDGRNRQAACIFADIEPIYQDYAGDDPLNFVLSLNLHRRHLTESQRAMVAAKIVDWENGLNQTTGRAHVPAREAGKRLSISERAVKAARRIREHGDASLIAAMEDGRISIKTGETLSWLEGEEQARVLRDEEKAVTAKAKEIRARRQKLNHEGRIRHMTLVAEAGNRSAGTVVKHYPVIYADPPWKFGVHSEVTGREKSAENHYPTLDTDAICNVLAEAGGVAARDAVLFLWATNPMLPDALKVMAAWGFTYVHHWVWDKEVAGTGYWGRDRHELLLIGRRGSPATPLPGSQPETVHRARKGRHSAKPEWFAEQIERLYPGVPKIELFCRSPRPGWDVWGFEATGEAGQNDETVLSQSEGRPRATPCEGAAAADNRPIDDGSKAATLAREFGLLAPAVDMTPQREATQAFVGDLRERARTILSEADSDYGRMMRTTLLSDRLSVDWGTALKLVDEIDTEDVVSEAPPADQIYPLAVEHVRKSRNTSAAHLSRYFDISADDASALLDRMIAEKVLPLPRVEKQAGGRKAVAA